jgi:hypothetical protein
MRKKITVSELRCPYCGRQEVIRIHRRWWEKLVPGLRAVFVCDGCDRRFWRPVFPLPNNRH